MDKQNDAKLGFTLAEVLITLVIIGVIAAITIPAVINTYVESSTVSKVKKGLSILGQAKILAETQNGPIQDWDFGIEKNAASSAQFWSYIRPHLQVVQDCGSATNCYQSNGVYKLSGSYYSDHNYNTESVYYKFVLSDGGVMWFRTSAGKCLDSESGMDNVCAVFWYDVNGDKEPNTFGRDVFLYAVLLNGVTPFIYDDCYTNKTGFGCSSFIIKKNNMKYLH